MSGTQTQTQSTSQTNTPFQQGYLSSGFQAAQNALKNSPTNTFTASLTPSQLQTYNALTTGGMGAMGAGGSALNTGANGLSSSITGLLGYDPTSVNNTNANIAGANQYVAGANIPGQVGALMTPAVQEAQEVLAPSIEASAAGTGNTNSSRTGVAEGLLASNVAQDALAAGTNLTANAYNTGAGLTANTNTANVQAQLAALEGAGNMSSSSLWGGSGALSSGGNLALSGATGPTSAQEQYAQFNANSPFFGLDNYLPLIGNINAGGTSSGTGTTQTTPSALQMIGSLLGAGGSLVGSRPSAFGGGSGLLGMFG